VSESPWVACFGVLGAGITRDIDMADSCFWGKYAVL
jgi:hypothetical protein